MKSSIKSIFTILIVAGCTAVVPAYAGSITFSGGTNTGSYYSNTRTFSADGVTVDVTADSFDPNAGTWGDAHLGLYIGGLGVFHGRDDNSHTVDNMGWNDRVKFIFDSSVILDSAYLSAFGDTDITVYYLDGSSWVNLEDNLGGYSDRSADVNARGLASTGWAIGGLNPADSSGDKFKIKSINFEVSGGTTTNNVPESSSSLMLLIIAIGLTEFARRRATNN